MKEVYLNIIEKIILGVSILLLIGVLLVNIVAIFIKNNIFIFILWLFLFLVIFKFRKNIKILNKVSNIYIYILIFIFINLLFLFLSYNKLAGDVYNTYNYVTNSPDLLYLKVFPFLIPYIYVLKGVYYVIGNFHISFIILNILFQLITLYFYLKLVKRNYNDNFKKLFVFIWLFNPINISFSVVGLNVVMFNMLLVIVLYFISEFLNFKDDKNIIFISVLVAISMALANAVRPIMVIFIIAIIIIFILVFSSLKNKKLKIKFLASIFIISLLFNFTFKNINSGMYSIIKSDVVENVGGWNIYVGTNYKYKGAWNGEDYSYFLDKLRNNKNHSQVLKEMRQEGIDRYLSYTNKEKVLLVVKKFTRLVIFAQLPFNLETYEFIYKIKNLINPLFSYFGLLLILFSLVKSIKLYLNKNLRTFYDLFLITAFNGLVLAFLLVEVVNRYFIPMMVLLIIYSLDIWGSTFNKLMKK